MRAFTLRSAERQVELQDVPQKAVDQTKADLPAATQVRSLSPGWIGLTILVPLVFCFVSAGVFRTIVRTRRSTASNSSSNGSLFKNGSQESRANNGSEAATTASQHTAATNESSSAWKVQQQQQLEIATLESKESSE